MPIDRLWLLRLFIVSIARHNFTLSRRLTTSRRLVFDKTITDHHHIAPALPYLKNCRRSRVCWQKFEMLRQDATLPVRCKFKNHSVTRIGVLTFAEDKEAPERIDGHAVHV